MDTIVTVATLVLLLASLLVVNRARSEAKAERETGRAEAEAVRAEVRQALTEVQRREERVAQREKQLHEDQRNAQAYVRSLDDRVAVVARDEKRLISEREAMAAEHDAALAELAGMSVKEAKAKLMATLKEQAAGEAAALTQRAVTRAREEAAERAREVLVEAMQREAAATSTHASVVRIALPSEEMKGRIIGREGRNIRVFESLTGVNVAVEEGSNAVTLSSFDVARREIAEVALRALVEDGRIQPQRIEAAYAQAVADEPERSRAAAIEAIEAAGIGSVGPSLMEPLGALRLRTSYNQNVLAHLVEVARMAAAIAEQIGADVELARRGGFLHDIGKAFTGQRGGTHAQIGAALAAQAGESDEVVNAIAAHHDEKPQETLEAVIVQIADTLSAARPGARRDESETYVERMEALEHQVATFDGVAQAFAMAAGRELRVVVEPTKIDDEGLTVLARTIAEHIESDAGFPGEIKVTVIRETRADSVAGQA